MPRRAWTLLALAALAGGGAMALFRPRPDDAFPLARLVPADAVLYAGFDDVRRLESLLERSDGADGLRRRLEAARPHLAGPAAVYLDRDLHWVFLGRLGPAAAALAGVEREGDVAVSAETKEALERHRRRAGSILDVPAFGELRTPVFLNLDRLGLGGRLADFSAAGFEIAPGEPAVLRGRLAYRPEVFRAYLEHYVHAPRTAGLPEGPVGISFVEPLSRVWDEALAALSPAERERAEREAALLSRDFLDGRPLRDFLGRLGPSGLLTVLPGEKPGFALSLELPDPEAAAKLPAMLPRVAQDMARNRQGRGLPVPFEIAPEEDFWRVRIRDGKLAPVYAFRDGRWNLAGSPALLAPRPIPSGEHHVAAAVEPELALRALEEWGIKVSPAWRERLAGIGRIALTGRYTGQGLDVELRLWKKAP
jgi:hypothetical protein